MDLPALLWLVAKFFLLMAGLLGPGAAMMRALRVPVTVATSFAGSVVTIYTTVLALQLTSVRISLLSLSAGLVVITLVALFASRPSAERSPGAAPPNNEGAGFRDFLRQMGPWSLLYG